jgi:carotenoid cleavage dioxygenase-like enzyme
MTVRFPDEPGFQGRFAPVRLEGEIRGLEVITGEVPASLSGTFYRVGADPAWPPFVERDFYFNADGMVAMFRFENGYVDFRSRYVRTPRFKAERAARRSLFGAYRNPFTDDPSVAGLSRGLANTNVYWHAGRLLASKEDSKPIQIDPDTLDTVGEYDWDGDLSSQTATAHPKIDPRDGSLVFFGYMASGETTPDIAYYEADASGRIVHEAWFTAPYSSMVHDWAVTENFVVFPIIPLTASLDRISQGGPYYMWDGSEDVYLGVVPRRGSQVRWYRGTNRFASHIMNAFDDGRFIHVDTPVGEKSAFPWFPDIDGAPFDPEKTKGYLSRWTIDTHAEPDAGPGVTTFAQRRLTDCAGEFPRTDERRAGRDYRFGVINLTHVPGEVPDDGIPGGFRWLASIDPATGAMKRRFAGREATVQEAIFVPPGPNSQNDSGFILQLIDRHATGTTDLLLLDAQHIDAPPVAALRIPIRMPGGLHGNWVTSGQLATRAD